jgi:hypothetical protein
MTPPAPTPAGAPGRLPVGALIGGTFRLLFVEHLRLLPRAAALPLAISLLLMLLQLRLALALAAGADPGQAVLVLLGLLFTLADLVPYVIFAVAWHRLILLGAGSVAPERWTAWRRRHWRFLGYAIALSLIAMLPFSLPSLLALGGSALPGVIVPASVAAMVVAVWLSLRLGLVLPAQAIEARYGFADSWRQMRGHCLGLLLCLLVIQLVVLLPAGVVLGALGGPGDPEAAAALMTEAGEGADGVLLLQVLPSFALAQVMVYLGTAAGVTALSLAFRSLTGGPPPAPGA